MNRGIGQIPIDLSLDGSLVLFKVVRHKEQHKFSRLGSLNDESKSCASNLTISH